MRARQQAGTFGIGNIDHEFPKTLASNVADNIKGRHGTFRQFAEPVLGSNFPSRRRTDKNVVSLVRNHPARRVGQAPTVCKPPKKSMGVQQCPQRYFPSQAPSSSPDSGSKKSSGRTIFPLRTSGCRLPLGLQPTSRATGSPLRAITTSSPASTCVRSLDR